MELEEANWQVANAPQNPRKACPLVARAFGIAMYTIAVVSVLILVITTPSTNAFLSFVSGAALFGIPLHLVAGYGMYHTDSVARGLTLCLVTFDCALIGIPGASDLLDLLASHRLHLTEMQRHEIYSSALPYVLGSLIGLIACFLILTHPKVVREFS